MLLPLARRANSVMPRSISSASRSPTGLALMQNHGRNGSESHKLKAVDVNRRLFLTSSSYAACLATSDPTIGPESVAKAVQDWIITAVGANTANIAPASPGKNGFIESFNACPRDELLNGEIFYTLREAQIVSPAGGATTPPSDLTPRSATGRRHHRSSSRQSPRGRLRWRPCQR